MKRIAVTLTLALLLAVAGCNAADTPTPAALAPSATPVPPSATPEPSATAVPSATASSTPVPPTATPVPPTATASATATEEPSLPPQPLAVVTSASANLRGGPGTVYGIVGRAVEGDSLPVTGRNADGSWLLVLDAENRPAWVAASLVELSGDPQALAAATPPPTPEAAPTSEAPAAPAAPAAAAGTLGPNLLIDPGFEEYSNAWTQWGEPAGTIKEFFEPDQPHSGARAALVWGNYFEPLYQDVFNAIPGETYRLGVWVHMGTTDETKFYPGNPDLRTYAFICLNTVGVEDVRDPHSVCTPLAEPWNEWLYMTVDAVAESENIAVVFMQRKHETLQDTLDVPNFVIYDDAYLGLVSR